MGNSCLIKRKTGEQGSVGTEAESCAEPWPQDSCIQVS